MSLASHLRKQADTSPASGEPCSAAQLSRASGRERATPRAREALRRETAAVVTAPEGERNNTLNIAAFNLGQLVGSGELPEDQVRAELVSAADRAGLTGREVAATIRSGLDKGIASPRPTDANVAGGVASPADELEWLGIAELWAPLEPVRWLVQGLDFAPGAPALLAGYGFSGKTVAAQSLAVSIAAGVDAWGVFPVRRGRVRHFDFEQGARLTRERYQRLAAGMDVPPSELDGRLAVVSHPRFYFDSAGAEDALCRWLDACDLAIIDSFRAACPATDENSSEARRPLDMLARVSERTGCLALVIHHARKPSKDGAGGAKTAIRGSSALFDACASVLCFEGVKGKPVAVAHEKARITGEPTDDFQLAIRDVEIAGNSRSALQVIGMRSLAAPNGSSGRVDAVKRLILAYLAEHGSAPGKNALGARLGGDRNVFYAALAELEAAGVVADVGKHKAPKLVLKGGTDAVTSGV